MKILFLGDIVGHPGVDFVQRALPSCLSIEQQLNYPGEIKVTVVRETRSVEIAK